MPSFTSSDDLRRYVGGIFDQALADDALGPKLVDTGLTLKVVTTEPDAVLMIDLPNRSVRLGFEGDDADATMRMSTDVANRFWQGKVNLPVAMARGQIKVEGKVAALLKLVPLTKQMFPVYVTMLTADGREDLLVSP